MFYGREDILADLSEHFKYVVEVKRKREIGTEVVDEVREKVARLGLKRLFAASAR